MLKIQENSNYINQDVSLDPSQVCVILDPSWLWYTSHSQGEVWKSDLPQC